ncbi:MAG: hypothetical protein V3S59_06060 [Alphaproteobacteria bacterium]
MAKRMSMLVIRRAWEMMSDKSRRKQKGEAALTHPRYRRRALDHRPINP